MKDKISEELAEFIVEKIVLEYDGEYIVNFNNRNYVLLVDSSINRIFIYIEVNGYRGRVGFVNNKLEIYDFFGFIIDETKQLFKYMETVMLDSKLSKKTNKIEKKVSKM